MIIGFANVKGNVGKTVSTMMLGELLVKNGKKVLLIDADPQASLSINLGIENIDTDDKTTYEYFSKDIAIRNIVKNLENYDLMSSKIELMNLDKENEESEILEVKEKLDKLKKEYDYILVDFPPYINFLTLNISRFAEKIMIVTDTGNMSKMKALETMKIMESFIDEKIKFAGVIVTKVTEETDHMDKFNDLPIYKIDKCNSDDELLQQYQQILKDIL